MVKAKKQNKNIQQRTLSGLPIILLYNKSNYSLHKMSIFRVVVGQFSNRSQMTSSLFKRDLETTLSRPELLSYIKRVTVFLFCFIIMFGSIVTGNATKPNSVQTTRGVPTAITPMWLMVFSKGSLVPSTPFATKTRIQWRREAISVRIIPHHLVKILVPVRNRIVRVQVQQETEMAFPICFI